MKKFFKIFLILISVPVLGYAGLAILISIMAHQIKPSAQTPHIAHTLVHFILRNTNFKEPDRPMAIPADVFMDGIMPQEGAVDDSILLQVHWPDFSGNVADLTRNYVRILVQTKNPAFSESQVMKNFIQGDVMSDEQDPSEVFTSNIPIKLIPPQPVPDQTVPSDIMQVANTLNSTIGRNNTQIYVDKAPFPSRIINCSALDIKKNQFSSCSNNFFYKNLWFKVSYDRPYVAQWKEIEQAVKDHFDVYMRQP